MLRQQVFFFFFLAAALTALMVCHPRQEVAVHAARWHDVMRCGVHRGGGSWGTGGRLGAAPYAQEHGDGQPCDHGEAGCVPACVVLAGGKVRRTSDKDSSDGAPTANSTRCGGCKRR